MNESQLTLPEQSPEVTELLWRGSIDRGGQRLRAVPEDVGEGPDGPEVRFRVLSSAGAAPPGQAKVWWRASRAYSLTATATPCVAVLAYGMVQGWALRPVLATLAVLGALLLQLSVNLWNDAEDYVRLIDLPGTLGGSGVLQKGWLSAREVRRGAIVLLIIGLACGVPALLREPRLWAVGGAALLGVMGYSGRPIALKYRALGDLTVALLCGPALTVGCSLAAFGDVDAGVIALGGLLGLFAVALLHVNNLQDVDVDLPRGAVTMASRLGDRGSLVYLASLYATALVGWGWGWRVAHLPVVALVLPLLVAVPVGRFVSAMWRGARTPAMAMARVDAAKLHLLVGAALCVGLGVSAWR